MKLFLSAGEASGDALGGALLEEIHRLAPDAEAFGMGGEAMSRARLRSIEAGGQIGVVGFAEVIRHLPRLFRLADRLAEQVIAERPDLAVLIDVPDFHLRVAKKISKAGIPCVFYVGPSVWAWRPWRARSFAKVAKKMLVLFPFELPPWVRYGVPVECVGHPLLDAIEAPKPSSDIRGSSVTLMPGSRPSEIARHWPLLLQLAQSLEQSGHADRFIVPIAPGLDVGIFGDSHEDLPGLSFVEGEADRRAAIAESRLVVVASGTATLEVALLGRPQIIVYRMSPFTWELGRRLARVEYLGLVNLITGRVAAPELLQDELSLGRLRALAVEILEDSTAVERAQGVAREIAEKLGERGAARRAAAAVLALTRS